MDDRGRFHEICKDESLKELIERKPGLFSDLNPEREFRVGETFPLHGFVFMVAEITPRGIRIVPKLENDRIVRARDDELEELRRENAKLLRERRLPPSSG